jgi:hypothetical protein
LPSPSRARQSHGSAQISPGSAAGVDEQFHRDAGLRAEEGLQVGQVRKHLGDDLRG